MSNFIHLIHESSDLFKKKYTHIKATKYILVSPRDQILLYISNDNIIKNYSISTSKFGLGNLNDSFMTPTGLHCIEERIGADMPIRTIFRGRKPIENNMTLDDLYKSEKLRLEKAETFWLSESPEVPSIGWDAALNRITTVGIFSDVSSNKEFIVYNSHFDHIGKIARENSVNVILNLTELINGTIEKKDLFL